MFGKPQAEHAWLEKFVGRWDCEAVCQMPDQTSSTMKSQVTGRMVGGLWLVLEGEGVCPEMGPWKSLMTLGYDPVSSKYVGTFVGSMMTHLWQYSGNIDTAHRKLVLDTTGPKCDQSPGMGTYKDTVEVVDDDHWILSSQLQGDDGQWNQFMAGHHRRIK